MPPSDSDVTIIDETDGSIITAADGEIIGGVTGGAGTEGGGDVGGGGEDGGQSAGRDGPLDLPTVADPFDPNNRAPVWVYDGRYEGEGRFGGTSDFATPQGTAIRLSLSDLFSDPDGDTLIPSFTLPAGLRYDPATQLITGRITENIGTFWASFSVDDQNGISVSIGTLWEITAPVPIGPDTGKLLITSNDGWVKSSRSGNDVYTMAKPGSVYLGHTDGVARLLQIVDADEIKVDQTGLHVKGGAVIATVSGDTRVVFGGDFTLDLNTLATTKLEDKGSSRAQYTARHTDDFLVTAMRIQTDAAKFEGDVTLATEGSFGLGKGSVTATFDANGVGLNSTNLGGLLPTKSFEFSAAGQKLKATVSDFGLTYSNSFDSWFVSGKAKLSLQDGVHTFTADLRGKSDPEDSILAPGEHYIRFGDIDGNGKLDFDVSLEGSYKYKPLYGEQTDSGSFLGLRELSAKVDTYNNTFEGSAQARIPFLTSDLTAEVGFAWDPFVLDSWKAGIKNAAVPFFGGIVLTSGEVGVSDLTNTSKDGVTFEAEVGGYWGAGRKKLFDATIGIEATEKSAKLDITGNSTGRDWFGAPVDAIAAAEKTLDKYFGFDLDDFLDSEIFNLDVSGKWKYGDSITLQGTLKGLFDTLEMQGSVEWGTAGNGADMFSTIMQGRFIAPKNLAVIGGKEFFGAGIEIQKVDDNFQRNDYLRVWTTFDVFDFEAAYGFELNGAFEFSWLGKEDIPLIGSWQLEPTLDWAMMSASWDVASNNAKLIVITPDGTRLTEADIDSRADIEIVSDLSSPTSRSVAVARPQSGIWDIEIVSPDDLGEITYEASNGIKLPEFSGWALDLSENGMLSASVTVESDDVPATLRFFVDTDDEGIDGAALTDTPLTVTGGQLTQEFDLSTFAPGTYHVYAIASGNDIASVHNYAPTAIVLEGFGNLAVSITEGLNTAPGEQTFTVITTNTGSRAILDASLDLTLPAFGVQEAVPFKADPVFFGGAATVALGQIAAGESVSYSMSVNVDDTVTSGQITATATTPQFESDNTDNLAVFELGDPQDRSAFAPSDFTTGSDRFTGENSGRIQSLGGDDLVVTGVNRGSVDTGSGRDVAVSFIGQAAISGGQGDDFLVGGMQADTISGGAGDDIIKGDASAMFGGSDVLSGGVGDDTLMGGQGADSFVFRPNDGNDTIASFEIAAVAGDAVSQFGMRNLAPDFVTGMDSIVLTGFEGVTASNVLDFVTTDGDTTRFSAEGTTIHLFGLNAQLLEATDFVFV